jgi:hypothetical protein
MSLFQAATSGTLQEIETRIKHGADVNERNKNGETPLHRAAAFNRSLSVLNALISNGAKLNAKEKEHGQTPLHYAVLNNAPPRILESLVRHGADPMVKDRNGVSPLDAADSDEKKRIMAQAKSAFDSAAMQPAAPELAGAEKTGSQETIKIAARSEGDYIPEALSDEELKRKRAESENKLDGIILERHKIEEKLNIAKGRFLEGGKIIKDARTKHEAIAKLYPEESAEAGLAKDPEYQQGCKIVSEAKSKISSIEQELKDFDQNNAPSKAVHRLDLDEFNNLLELDAVSRAEYVYQSLEKRRKSPNTEAELFALADDFRAQLSGYKNSAALAAECENTAKILRGERRRRELLERTVEMAAENVKDKTMHRILASTIPGWSWLPLSMALLKPGELANSSPVSIFAFIVLWGATVYLAIRLCKKYHTEWYFLFLPIAVWMTLFSLAGCPPKFMGPAEISQDSANGPQAKQNAMFGD